MGVFTAAGYHRGMDAETNTSDAELRLGHSPDPDDAFMWWPLGTKGAEGAPADVLQLDPAINTGSFRYRPVVADIQALNRRAIDHGDLDVTAVSMHAYGHVRGRYVLTDCGASFGDGYGPKVIVPSGVPKPGGSAREDERGAWLRALVDRGAKVAVPGFETSAYLVLRMVTGEAGERAAAEGRFVAMRFDRVLPAVLDGSVDAGVVIHEAQVTYAGAGFGLVIDLGAWWASATADSADEGAVGLPLPLGANAVRRDVDDRFGSGTLRTVARTLSSSIDHALTHRAEAMRYASAFVSGAADAAGGVASAADVDRFLDLYVNDLTRSMGARGRRAVREFLARGEALGLVPESGEMDVVSGL